MVHNTWTEIADSVETADMHMKTKATRLALVQTELAEHLHFFLRSRGCSSLSVGGLVDGHTSAHQMWWSSLTQREHRT